MPVSITALDSGSSELGEATGGVQPDRPVRRAGQVIREPLDLGAQLYPGRGQGGVRSQPAGAGQLLGAGASCQSASLHGRLEPRKSRRGGYRRGFEQVRGDRPDVVSDQRGDVAVAPVLAQRRQRLRESQVCGLRQRQRLVGGAQWPAGGGRGSSGGRREDSSLSSCAESI